MIKVIVNGACGRMGSTVVDAVMKDSELKLVGAVDIVGGMDAGDKAGCGNTGGRHYRHQCRCLPDSRRLELGRAGKKDTGLGI